MLNILDNFRPENGVIDFDNYSTRYRDGLDLVLKGNCTVLIEYIIKLI